jgi:hypothetical protein
MNGTFHMELKWYNQLIIFNHICIHDKKNVLFAIKL